MQLTFKSLPDLFDRFADQQTCVAYLEQQRWGGTPVCPHCNHAKSYKTNRGYKCANKECHKKFTVTVGTFFENTKVPLRLWFAAIYLVTSNKKGISSVQLAEQLQIEQKTAWFLNHRIREMLREKAPVMLEDEVEVDETHIGGKDKNKHAHKRSGVQGSVKNKTTVIGLVQRGGKILCLPVDSTKGKHLLPIMVATVKPRSTVYTDQHQPYRNLKHNYDHHSVNHGVGEYVRGKCHTNTIEGAWGLLKRFINGTHHQVSPKHLHKYCNEFSFRYNSRDLSAQEKFDLALQRSSGRLLYKQLTAN